VANYGKKPRGIAPREFPWEATPAKAKPSGNRTLKTIQVRREEREVRV